jgi:hypothetical protein
MGDGTRFGHRERAADGRRRGDASRLVPIPGRPRTLILLAGNPQPHERGTVLTLGVVGGVGWRTEISIDLAEQRQAFSALKAAHGERAVLTSHSEGSRRDFLGVKHLIEDPV